MLRGPAANWIAVERETYGAASASPFPLTRPSQQIAALPPPRPSLEYWIRAGPRWRSRRRSLDPLKRRFWAAALPPVRLAGVASPPHRLPFRLQAARAPAWRRLHRPVARANQKPWHGPACRDLRPLSLPAFSPC